MAASEIAEEKVMATVSQKGGSPTPGAFRQFLKWLDEGVESNGQKYLEMRRRLVHYFDRKNCLSPDDLADETLSRVTRRLGEEGGIVDTPPARYCYIVAKFVFLEHQRRPGRRLVSLDSPSELGKVASRLGAPFEPDSGAEAKGKLLNCLEQCLQELKPDDRKLIFGYYRGEQGVKIENRRELAARLGLTMNALSIRACRIREKLEACVRTCSAER
jgi:DNA-directed RNA polymerase specialized sigma24 family protein